MFVSANFLAINYGVDDTIARFFADREPPADNLYWKDKLMYLRPEPGWIFIPLIVDLLYKAGIPRVELLSDKFVTLMESIGHVSAEEESGRIGEDEAIAKVIGLLSAKTVNQNYFENLMDYINGGKENSIYPFATPYNALHRGDLFLFSLSVLNFDDALQTQLIKSWFAIITTLLLLDDADDIEIDKVSGDKNAFIEIGLTQEGIEKLKSLVKSNLMFISSVNKPMAATLDKKFVTLSRKPYISELLNQ